jgi:hypothetical protein
LNAATLVQLEETSTQLYYAASSLVDRNQTLAVSEITIQTLSNELYEKTTSLRLARSELLELRGQKTANESDAQQQLRSAEQDLKAAKAAISEHAAMVEQLSRALELQKKERRSAEERTAVDIQNTELRAQKAETALSKSQEALNLRDSLLTDVRSRQKALESEATETTTTLRLLRHEVAALRSSTSWRLTKPLRFISRLLTRSRQVLIRRMGKSKSAPRSD